MEQSYFTFGEREYLLKVVRSTIAAWIYRQESFEPSTVNQKLWADHSVTVTLYYGRKLLGRASTGERRHALLLAVRDETLAAIKATTRINTISASQLPAIKAEIVVEVLDARNEPQVVVFGDRDNTPEV